MNALQDYIIAKKSRCVKVERGGFCESNRLPLIIWQSQFTMTNYASRITMAKDYEGAPWTNTTWAGETQLGRRDRHTWCLASTQCLSSSQLYIYL